jgi:trehalose/maltose transport system substrate-binding protein
MVNTICWLGLMRRMRDRLKDNLAGIIPFLCTRQSQRRSRSSTSRNIIFAEGVSGQSMRGFCARWPSYLKMAALFGILLLSLQLGCSRASHEPVTVSFLDPEWSHDTTERSLASQAALRKFTQETGIQVNHLPGPESATDQLQLISQLLQKGTGSPDVFGIDVIWPGILQPYLVDLKPEFKSEDASEDRELLANFTVDGRLVAVPYHTNIGVLSYRTDLLKDYGFHEPPRTWNELEKMALRIQEGQRAKGNLNFWGFMWPGSPSEGLTCNALEWQYSQGGGQIIDGNRKITVNNANTIRAWQRAARWIGWISPPSGLAYQEWDGTNAFNISGTAAFIRGWTSEYVLSQPVKSPVSERFGVTSVPGEGGQVGVLGGFGLGVSRSSAHRTEAISLVRFLVDREHQLEAARTRSGPPPWPQLFNLPPILKAYSRFAEPADGKRSSTIARPSTVTGEKYSRVSRSYFQAVHTVLTGKVKAQEAAAALEKELIKITGFDTGQPKTVESIVR